jgi:hypothetical protein
LGAANSMTSRFRPHSSDQIAALNLHNLSADLRQARDAFETALVTRDRFNPTTWDEVKAARAAGQQLYLQVVVQILAQFPGQSGEDADARATLLSPVWQQEDQVRAFRRQRRGPLLDVDPQSGELLETDVDAPLEPNTQAEPSPAT